MNLDDQVIKESLQHIKSIRRELIDKFASVKKFGSTELPVSVFMAGAPGAGKTELAQRLARYLSSKQAAEELLGKQYTTYHRIAHFDPDKIREEIPGYQGHNAHLFQQAITKAMSILFDYSQDKGVSFIFDGTFSKEKYAVENIKRSIGRGRIIIICFLYRDPFLSWKTVLSREIAEGRRIQKDTFVEAYFESIRVVNRMKKLFGNKISIWFMERRETAIPSKTRYKIELNINNIDGYITLDYDENKLYTDLPNSIYDESGSKNQK